MLINVIFEFKRVQERFSSLRVNVGLNKLVPFLLAIAYYSYVECEGWTEKAEEKKHNGRDKCWLRQIIC